MSASGNFLSKYGMKTAPRPMATQPIMLIVSISENFKLVETTNITPQVKIPKIPAVSRVVVIEVRSL